jgi:hypothetical protein
MLPSTASGHSHASSTDTWAATAKSRSAENDSTKAIAAKAATMAATA